MSVSPKKRSDWREILYLQARIGALFVPIAVGLAIVAALAGHERKTVPDTLDPTMTSSTGQLVDSAR
ncbi:hypothetical protein [Mesorhizobium sp. SP-1A]|jgi:hypothetical protein|uniref:hypothetical protein n=1 Tax=Mesorhizobium sp. SP-1A TaxID=3077840 RepID=UPI0028F6D97C|nr:hypothetical protein [Mesorhizobium sp. SP-1A]